MRSATPEHGEQSQLSMCPAVQTVKLHVLGEPQREHRKQFHNCAACVSDAAVHFWLSQHEVSYSINNNADKYTTLMRCRLLRAAHQFCVPEVISRNLLRGCTSIDIAMLGGGRRDHHQRIACHMHLCQLRSPELLLSCVISLQDHHQCKQCPRLCGRRNCPAAAVKQ